jgi:RNA ligase (TIGR02306 family)
MRKLVTVRSIDSISPIEGADAIECAQVGGWKVVVKKGEFTPGQLAMYFEIDSWIPENVAPFLFKDKREFNGVAGARLRTIRLRGQVSQGLLLPLADAFATCAEDDDITEAIGVQKWEAPVSAQLSGQVRGNFPSFIKKTDQERVQNLKRDLDAWQNTTVWKVTEKLDGSSMTVYLRDGEFGVCSRNLDLKPDEKNSFWSMAVKLDLESKMRELGANIAIQGELIGPAIQGNKYNLAKHQFRVFDVFDINSFGYYDAERRDEACTTLGLLHCPVLSEEYTITAGMDALLLMADGVSELNDKAAREGLVFKSISDPDISFKVISNKFLLAEK